MKKQWLLILGAWFFAVQFLYAGSGVYQSMTAPPPHSDPGWLATESDGQIFLVSPGEGPSPLEANDQIISIDGYRFKKASQASTALQNLPPSTPYNIVVKRAGQLFEFTLRTEPVPLLRVALLRLALAIILAIFLITGFTVFLLKPYDKQAVLLAWMFGMFTGLFPLSVVPGWLLGVAAVSRIVSILALPVFFHFFLTFPERSPLLRRFPRLEFYLYIPFLVTFFPYWVMAVVLDLFPSLSSPALTKFAILGRMGAPLIIVYIAGGLLSLLLNYRQASSSSRRRMRVIVAGSMAGFVPLLIFIGALDIFGHQKISPTLIQWMGWIELFTVPLFPLSFAYAIVRHQVIPVRLMLRRGVRYVFVSQGSIVLEMAAVFLSLAFVLYGFFTYLNTTNPLVIGVVSGIVSVVVWELTGYLHQRVIAPSIDRRFFRQAYNAQQILSEVGSALRYMTDVDEMTFLASSKIQDALHTESVLIFFPDARSGDYNSTVDQSDSGDLRDETSQQALALPSDGYVVKRLRNSAIPLVIDFDDPKSWAGRILVGAPGHSSQAFQLEHDVLLRARSALLLPISTKDSLYGVLSVGKRLGDLPFSREDKQLLSALAWQMAFAVENSQLVRRMAEEERLRVELDMATEVQRRLFPESPPALDSVELCGICVPARGVGGDYYDFLDLNDGKLGIAVADVAGKGISAALLMSIVQASLRSQASSVNGRLTELVSSMNRLLHRSTGTSGYASFFYAQFDEGTNALTYVNAGHNPPILVKSGSRAPLDMIAIGNAPGKSDDMAAAAAAPARAMSSVPRFSGHVAASSPEAGMLTEDTGPARNQEWISPLTTGGMVIGLFEESSYEQESVQLGSGDLLVAYTDGITEALNSDGEEFGEPRLRAIIAEKSTLSADQISGIIIESVDDWCAGMPPHDDLTLVIMKVK
jgi:sigma-B regulation protein RsbU (phosphoserine phosphatase)